MRLVEKENLLKSLNSSFISNEFPADSFTMPALLVNDWHNGKKILCALNEELETCEAFDFSVAFINDSGLACILQKLDYLASQNIKGRILTTNYLNFTSPGSLSKLLEFPNIEVRVYTKGGFHPKGYIFKQSNYHSIIIGSANLTASALSQNQEWSIKFLSLTDGQIVYSVQEEFERVWKESDIVTSEWITDYTIDYNLKKVKLQTVPHEIINEIKAEHILESDSIDLEDGKDDEVEIVPNAMQKEAMTSLAELRAKNENRALLIAATGTGKTYVYTRTMFELHKRCGFNKFIIAVPTLPIKAGTASFLTEPEVKRHFQNVCDYNAEIELCLLEPQKQSKKGRQNMPSAVGRFFFGNHHVKNKIYVLLLNTQLLTNGKLLTRDDYDQMLGEFHLPVDAIANTKPVLIIDEPHRVERSGK